MANRTIEITGTNIVELETKAAIFQHMNTLPSEDLDRLGKLAKNPKALKSLKDKWGMLLTMFG